MRPAEEGMDLDDLAAEQEIGRALAAQERDFAPDDHGAPTVCTYLPAPGEAEYWRRRRPWWQRLCGLFRGGEDPGDTAAPAPAVRGLHEPPRRPPVGPPINPLVHRCAQATIDDLRRTVQMELLLPDDPTTPALLLAGRVIESELVRLVAHPARDLADELVVAQKTHSPRIRTAAVERWAAGASPPTLGIVCQLLLGLRWGLEQERPPIREFLHQTFEPPYSELVADRRFGQAADRVRCEYRNKLVHDSSFAISTEEYRTLAKLVLGDPSTVDWWCRRTWSGAPDAGVLTSHLAYSRQAAPSDDTPAPLAERLLILPTRDQGWKMSLASRTVRRGGLSTRDLARDIAPSETAAGAVPSCMIGQSIELELHSAEACHVVVLDLGTSGCVSTVAPSDFCPLETVAAGVTVLPPPAGDGTGLGVSGPPGLEHVVAVGSREPLPREAEVLLARLETLAPGTWSAAAATFRVTP